MRQLLLLLALLSACTPVAHDAEPPPKSATPTEVVTPLVSDAAPEAPPKTTPVGLPGIATDNLTMRERRTWLAAVSELYAPCPDQAVSIATCVTEARPCAACAPAARLLAAKAHEGATMTQERALFARRFGPDKKEIDVADSPSLGPADAKVTIVVWSDFACPHCRAAMPIFDGLREKYAPNVRVVHKFYPLEAHPNSDGAARAAIAAQRQGRYWEMERLLFAHQQDQTPADLTRYAASLKLDAARFRADMASKSAEAIVARDRADAERLGLEGTPFIFINGREFDPAFFHFETDLEPWLRLELGLDDKAGD